MWHTILVIVLYVLGMGFFTLLGGIGSAARALQEWGRLSAGARRNHASVST